MARGKPVDLATRSFPNQSAATEYFRAMLNRYRPGETVATEDGLDLATLLDRHPEYDQKVGCGVAYFAVMMTEHGTQCFRIIRKDGTGTDFSYPTCVRGRPPTRKQEVSQAFRRAVRFDLFNARDKFIAEHKGPDGLVSCSITGERIAPDEGHIDHKPPMTFEVIVSTFLQGRGLAFADVPVTNGHDEQVTPELADSALADHFRRYHAGVAKLDFVKARANLAQAPKHRVKGGRLRIELPES
jgi:hypothetical protein